MTMPDSELERMRKLCEAALDIKFTITTDADELAQQIVIELFPSALDEIARLKGELKGAEIEAWRKAANVLCYYCRKDIPFSENKPMGMLFHENGLGCNSQPILDLIASAQQGGGV